MLLRRKLLYLLNFKSCLGCFVRARPNDFMDLILPAGLDVLFCIGRDFVLLNSDKHYAVSMKKMDF